ncbi:MAG: phosphatase PAP2 family protein [Clostridiales bacterium]|nr:phosphatase PAP2 family protein [Clostridiales bacterium]
MRFEVDLIKALQTLRSPFMDILNQFLSFFGTETFFLIIAVVLYWVVDKAFAHRFFNVYILGVAVTSVMKIGFKRVRPFNAYPNEVVSIQSPEPSYSFPSGHTQTVSTVGTVLSLKYGKQYRIVPIAAGVLTLLVMLSRMYLGQHYLSDVFCGLTVGVFCSILFNILLSFLGNKEEWFALGAIVLSVVLICVLAGLNKLGESEDLLKGIGAFAAFNIGYYFEKRYIRYDIKATRVWWKLLIRLVVGGGVTVAVQQLFKLFLPQEEPMLYCYLRYFIMALWASLGAPAVFKAVKI